MLGICFCLWLRMPTTNWKGRIFWCHPNRRRSPYFDSACFLIVWCHIMVILWLGVSKCYIVYIHYSVRIMVNLHYWLSGICFVLIHLFVDFNIFSVSCVQNKLHFEHTPLCSIQLSTAVSHSGFHSTALGSHSYSRYSTLHFSRWIKLPLYCSHVQLLCKCTAH